MTIVAIIVGALLGGWMDREFAILAGALLGWLAARSWSQQRELAALRRLLEVPQLRAGAAAAPVPAADEMHAQPDEDALPATLDTPHQPLQPALPARVAPGTETPATEDAYASWHQPAESQPAAPGRDLLAPIKAWIFGGNTIVKAGVGILFVGLAFLAKYAAEHVSVPIEMRLAGIAAVAMVLLIVGWRLRHKRAGYAQVLQGGAVAVLYLTLFAAFRLYGVLAAGPVFAMMAAVVALAAALAILQDARALAVIGALGGFATPLLLSTGSGNHVALFSYYLVLDLGIAAVAWHKTWRALNLVGFICTFVVATAWGVLKYDPANYATSQLFLIAFFLLFVAVLLMPARRLLAGADAPKAEFGDNWVNGTLLFGLPVITFVLQHSLVGHTEYGTAFSALVLAGFYVLLAMVMRSRPALALTFDASLAVAIVFLTLVIPFALDARSTAGAWALEGAGLVWLGFRQSRTLARAFGYALIVLSSAAMFWGYESHAAPVAVFNAYLINGLLAAAAAWAAAWYVHRDVSRSAGRVGLFAQLEPPAELVLIGLGLLWMLFALTVQVDNFVPLQFAAAVQLSGVSAIALASVALAVRLDWTRISWPAIGHAPVLALAVLDTATTLAAPVDDGGWWAWPLALATHGAVLWYAARRWPAVIQHAAHTLGVFVLAGLGALQGRAITRSWGDDWSAWPWLGWLALPALLLWLLPLADTAKRWPVSALPAAYRTTAASLLAAGLLCWVLLANVLSNGAAQPLPYLPLINPLDLGVAVALFAVVLWVRSDAAHAALFAHKQLPSHWPWAVLGAAGFVWLNAMLIRGFHHFGDVPFRLDAWLQSLAVQTGITLLWTATAFVLMWQSARRATRLPWMVGAGLLAAVVLKLLLVDLSGSGTVTRIVSFIGVGALMLVIGYVAPLPGRAALATEDGRNE